MAQLTAEIGADAGGGLTTADGRPLKAALRLAQRRAKRRALFLVLPLLLFGGSTLFNFSLAVFWGVLIGTFSSVYVAGALLLYLPAIRRTEAPAVAPGEPGPAALAAKAGDAAGGSRP